MEVRPIDGNALVEELKDWRGDKDDVDNAYDVTYYAAMSKAIRLCEGMPTMDYVPRQQWISVKDRLPPS